MPSQHQWLMPTGQLKPGRVRVAVDLFVRAAHPAVDELERVVERSFAQRYTRFVCVIRPLVHRSRQGLYVSYRALPNGRSRIHWLIYRH